MKDMKVRLTLTEEALGMMPADKELHETYIASNAPDAPSLEEEIAAVGVEEVVEKTKTVFPKMDGVPFYWDYQIRGMFGGWVFVGIVVLQDERRSHCDFGRF